MLPQVFGRLRSNDKLLENEQKKGKEVLQLRKLSEIQEMTVQYELEVFKSKISSQKQVITRYESRVAQLEAITGEG